MLKSYYVTNIAILVDSVLLIVTAAAALWLCVLEQSRGINSSRAILAYLACSLTRDLLELRFGGCSSIETCFFIKSRIVVEGTWLTSHLWVKDFLSHRSQESISTPEEAAGIFGRVFFRWMHPVLREGYSARLNLTSLPEIDQRLLSKGLRKRVLTYWARGSNLHTKWTLPCALAKCLKGPFLLPLLPRGLLILFTYLQPIFIGTAIRFVNGASQSILGGDSGLRLILFATTVYMGIAVSAAIYQHQINKLRVMVRGALIGLIHHQSLHLPNEKSQDSSALALISSDIDSIDSVGEILHETWARLVEVVTGTVLLAAHIQWFAFLPVIIIFGCSRMSAYVAKHLEDRQKDWNAATQNRLAATTAAIEGIKSLKMMGMEDAIQSQVLHLRNNEIQTSKRLRWILVAYNASANALGILAPVLTLILFLSSQSDGMYADQTFTALALLAMVTHPANMVMTLIPQAISVMANFDRIQAFINQPSIQDARDVSQGSQQFISMQALTVAPPPLYHPILRDVDLAITKGEIVTCAGAVGSGKTTLAMAVLGEATATAGLISLSSKEIAYCAQEPWLPSSTIREAISGYLIGLDIEWYNTVIEACGLVPDFHSFVAGDMTLIENNGMNLSGGQKQRIALARAVYSKYRMLVLDDPFSALDEAVTAHIVQRLLGPRGLFRKMATTVLLISNSREIFSISDRVLLLHNSRLHHQMHLQDPKAAFGVLSLPSKISHTLNPSYGSGSLGKSQKLHLSDAEDDTSRRTGDIAIYGYYINAIGRSNTLLLIVCTAGFSFCSTFAQYVLKWATESPRDRLKIYMSLYATISFIGWVATSGTVWATQMKVAVRSGAVLHAQLLDRIFKLVPSACQPSKVLIALN
ncbi:unnamed protein product [Penicillium glandicola]